MEFSGNFQGFLGNFYAEYGSLSLCFSDPFFIIHEVFIYLFQYRQVYSFMAERVFLGAYIFIEKQKKQTK